MSARSPMGGTVHSVYSDLSDYERVKMMIGNYDSIYRGQVLDTFFASIRGFTQPFENERSTMVWRSSMEELFDKVPGLRKAMDVDGSAPDYSRIGAFGHGSSNFDLYQRRVLKLVEVWNYAVRSRKLIDADCKGHAMLVVWRKVRDKKDAVEKSDREAISKLIEITWDYINNYSCSIRSYTEKVNDLLDNGRSFCLRNLNPIVLKTFMIASPSQKEEIIDWLVRVYRKEKVTHTRDDFSYSIDSVLSIAKIRDDDPRTIGRDNDHSNGRSIQFQTKHVSEDVNELSPAAKKMKIPEGAADTHVVLIPSQREPKAVVPDSDPKWIKFKRAEIDNLKAYDVFDEVPIPRGVNPISTKWVNTEKDGLEGVETESRCVLVSSNRHDTKSNDSESVSSSVEFKTIRTLTAVAADEGWEIHHMHVTSPYLNVRLERPIYAKPPPGFELKHGYCWKLKKALYGIRQSGYLWEKELLKFLEHDGFSMETKTKGLYRNERGGSKLIVCTYVGDIFIAGSSIQAVNEFKGRFGRRFVSTDFGQIKQFLGVKFTKEREGYSLSQTRKVKELLEDFGIMPGIGGAHTPMLVNNEMRESHIKITDHAFRNEEVPLSISEKRRYQSAVGTLRWLADITRPELSCVVDDLSQKLSGPSEDDARTLLHCLNFLKRYPDSPLKMKRSKFIRSGKVEVNMFVGARFNTPVTARSVSGCCVFVNDNLVDWKSKTQNGIQQKTRYSEVIALDCGLTVADVVCQAIRDIGQDIVSTKVFDNNEDAIKLAKDVERYHFSRDIRDEIERIHKKIDRYPIQCIPKLENLAMIFTRPLNTGVFYEAWEYLTDFDRKTMAVLLEEGQFLSENYSDLGSDSEDEIVTHLRNAFPPSALIEMPGLGYMTGLPTY